MNRDQIVLIKGLLEKEYSGFAALAKRPETSPLYDKAQADYYQHQVDKVKEAHKALIEEFAEVLHSDELLNKKDQKVWGVTIDGERVDTPLRTYSQARSQAHRIAERSDDWYGINVESFK